MHKQQAILDETAFSNADLASARRTWRKISISAANAFPAKPGNATYHHRDLQQV
jgi:hypothetical protein